MSANVETISKECVMYKHKWCSGEVAAPPELIPEGQTGIACQCPCHQGWPGRGRGGR